MRRIAGILFATGIGLSVLALSHHASAQIETAPPGLESPAPTAAPVVTAPLYSVPPYTPPVVNVGGLAAAGLLFTLLYLALVVFFIVSFWRLFTKAGEYGWAALIPIYNTIVLLKLAGRPWWWIFILWLIIPLVIVYIDLARNFGKTTGFAVGLIFLPFIFFPILAFGSAQYQAAPSPA